MTPEEYAWVRANVWRAHMRKTYREVPGAFDSCSCQYGASDHCKDGDHDACHVGEGLAYCEGYIDTRQGYVASFREPYVHPTQSAVGWRRESYAAVWLVGYRCRWKCPCRCHTRQVPTHSPAPTSWEQQDMFAGL